jgi:hypothetical protein
MSTKICLAVVSVLIAPLLVWLALPVVLVCLVGLAPFALPLAALVLVSARPHGAKDAPATLATPSLPGLELASPRRSRLPFVPQAFLALGPSNTVSFVHAKGGQERVSDPRQRAPEDNAPTPGGAGVARSGKRAPLPRTGSV